VCLFGFVSCFAGFAPAVTGITTGQKVKVEGWVVSRDAQSIKVNTIEMGEIAVVVTRYTKIHQPKGLFDIRKKQMPDSALLPGLRVKIKGIGNTQNQVIAESVSFSDADLRTAYAIQSGLIPVQNQVRSNTEQIASNQAHIESNQQQIATNQANIRSGQEQIANLDQRFFDLTQYAAKSTTLIYFSPGNGTVNLSGTFPARPSSVRLRLKRRASQATSSR